ncbi:Dephospho-CoA kinase [Thalassoglobus neptunius]|uniref:Dephospho-CoA kinase n=1 Tax=Thalassoglobus neptunius TaxID=1938619 RepID=A0A5C5WYS3_9PLAN|nr:dephospho-CoA kinase [Thalassoglobus neptunius]TWT55419.1 Dephospho-CoA kinase [Thalassoglobus neptunius]
MSIPVIGVIGGIGSGKTTFTRAVGERLNARVLDADQAGHRVLRFDSVKSQLREVFGEDIFDSDGEILRSALARRVFGVEDDQQAARSQLNQIVHPEIRKLLEEQLHEMKSEVEVDVIFLDAALMIEAGWVSICDAVVFLDVPKHVRLDRVAGRGWSAEELAQREASQLSLPEKRKRADFIVDHTLPPHLAAELFIDWFINQFETRYTNREAVSQPSQP